MEWYLECWARIFSIVVFPVPFRPVKIVTLGENSRSTLRNWRQCLTRRREKLIAVIAFTFFGKAQIDRGGAAGPATIVTAPRVGINVWCVINNRWQKNTDVELSTQHTKDALALLGVFL